MSFKRWSMFIILMVAGLFTAGWSAYIPARLEDRDVMLALLFTVLAVLAVVPEVRSRTWIVLLCLLIADSMTALAVSAWPKGITWFCVGGALTFVVAAIVHIWNESHSGCNPRRSNRNQRTYLGNALKPKD